MICDGGRASGGCVGGTGDGGGGGAHNRYDSCTRRAPFATNPTSRAGVSANEAPASASCVVSGAMVADRPAPATTTMPQASLGAGSAFGVAAGKIGKTTPLPTIGALPAITTSGEVDCATVNVVCAQLQEMATCAVGKLSSASVGLAAGVSESDWP